MIVIIGCLALMNLVLAIILYETRAHLIELQKVQIKANEHSIALSNSIFKLEKLIREQQY